MFSWRFLILFLPFLEQLSCHEENVFVSLRDVFLFLFNVILIIYYLSSITLFCEINFNTIFFHGLNYKIFWVPIVRSCNCFMYYLSSLVYTYMRRKKWLYLSSLFYDSYHVANAKKKVQCCAICCIFAEATEDTNAHYFDSKKE